MSPPRWLRGQIAFWAGLRIVQAEAQARGRGAVRPPSSIVEVAMKPSTTELNRKNRPERELVVFP
jgi:hypothetical protein